MGDSSVECRDFHDENITDICAFVNSTDDCSIDEGFINYTILIYCVFKGHLLPLGAILLFLWWLFLFCGLAVTADNFFCPSLAVISRTMRLSHNIAGVTFLAFGNGAPDIFSAIAAIGNVKAGDAGLAIGALFGAGVFVTTVIVGTISITCPFDAMQRPFLRDVIFFLAAVFWSFTIMWKKKITTFDAVGFIMMYVFYVLVVIIGRLVYQRQRTRAVPYGVQDKDTVASVHDGLTAVDNSDDETRPLLRPVVDRDEDVEIEREDLPLHKHPAPAETTPFKTFLYVINPIDIECWAEMRIFTKVYEVFKCPIVLILKLTIPVVDEGEEPHHGWNRHLNSLHCLTGPLFAIFATDLAQNTIGGKFPAYALVLIISVILALVVFFTSKNEVQPPYHAAFAYLGFLAAVIWIYSIANEIVNILQTFGIVLNITNAIIGLTLLAWGNSLGDFIADFTMARQGYPRMGISACFGGPLFNILLGIGIPFTIACIKKGGTFELQVTLEELFITGCVTVSLVFSLIVVPLSGFRMTRAYGICLLIYYLMFLVVALLIETNVIKNIHH